MKKLNETTTELILDAIKSLSGAVSDLELVLSELENTQKMLPTKIFIIAEINAVNRVLADLDLVLENCNSISFFRSSSKISQ